MKIQNDVNLRNYNTFKVEAVAKYFCEIKSSEDIVELLSSDVYKDNKTFFLGSGANTIFVNDFDGLIIKNEILGKEILDEDNDTNMNSRILKSNNKDTVQIKIWAGENRHNFVVRCAQNNLVGLENLAYIPSSVWATAVQNIWAYGTEAKDVIVSVEWINLADKKSNSIETKQTTVLSNEECCFGYRESVFKNKLKNKFIITHVTFELSKFDKIADYKFNCEYNGIAEKIEELWYDKDKLWPIEFVDVITEIRRAKLPDREMVWTAGSFFKNPVIDEAKRNKLKKEFDGLKWFPVDAWIKLSAGQLIDMCGFKWKGDGKVGTYKTHALVLVNEWKASGKDVMDFAKQIQDGVKNKFGIELWPEAIFVG